MKHLLYFGCIGRTGHYLHLNEHETCRDWWLRENLPTVNPNLEMRMDGTFTPAGIVEKEGIYRESIVPPLRIVAWWDRSLDNRFASNSALIGVGYASAEEMLDAAVKLYPSVMARQPRPVPEVLT
jgi:hypothetical protein